MSLDLPSKSNSTPYLARRRHPQPTRRLRLHLLPLAITLSSLLAPAPSHASEAELRREIEFLKTRMAQLEERLIEAENHSRQAPPRSTAPSTAASSQSSSGKSAQAADVDSEYIDTPSNAPGNNWWERTSIGGYGEMHLNLGDREQIDYHRWVLFLNHQFNERVRFVSELELEHSIAGDEQNGEIELEQAYLEGDFGNGWSGKAGLYLVPTGILNDTHEPTTFFGTERNPIEQEIIPTTWWEGGVLIAKRWENGLLWEGAFHSGLDVPSSGSNAFRIRSGRQKVSEADASEWAATTRLRYTGIPGLEIGGSAQFQSDITPAESEKNDAWFGEAHLDFRRGGFGLRALAGYWNIDGETPEALDLDTQWGFYVEPSYTFAFSNGWRLGFFGRYNQYEAARGDIDQWDAGINLWPLDNVVFKVDYSRIDASDAEDEDIFNVGMGFQF